MNIYDYIDEFGVYSFKEEEINLVDMVIFSFLSYADFKGIVGLDKITLKKAGRMHIGLHKEDELNIIAVKEANKMIRYMKDTRRYKDCNLFNYEYEGNDNIQFSAISIEYLPNKIYVSYEGTDQLISGWKEDLVLTYKFPTISHKRAIKYLNKYFTFSNKDIIIGGHSKGGNLALAAGMYSNFLVKRQIKEIYNVDGPGLLDKEFYSFEYKKVINKYRHIVPDNSIVGMLLNNTNETVIKTTAKGPITHDIAYWEIKDNEFVKSKLSPYSKNLRNNILNWVNRMSKNDLRIMVKNFKEICDKANVDSLLDIKQNKAYIIDLIKHSSTMDDKIKNLLLDFVKMVIKTIGDTGIEEIKTKIKNTNINTIKKKIRNIIE